MTVYFTRNHEGRIFVHSVWIGSYFIAVQFSNKRGAGKILPFSPFMSRRFDNRDEAEIALAQYAADNKLVEIA